MHHCSAIIIHASPNGKITSHSMHKQQGVNAVQQAKQRDHAPTMQSAVQLNIHGIHVHQGSIKTSKLLRISPSYSFSCFSTSLNKYLVSFSMARLKHIVIACRKLTCPWSAFLRVNCSRINKPRATPKILFSKSTLKDRALNVSSVFVHLAATNGNRISREFWALSTSSCGQCNNNK